ncbi:unnamed protein product [Ambrosiozyma monospora]|uniref:Unnamed protein product n=1 Tax=Ambrosiozyma monospora TaxID=43982 RepID=A0ACB5U796_AMBMO|nr:unnamed protein product [Ambrosiozyma monospora]
MFSYTPSYRRSISRLFTTQEDSFQLDTTRNSPELSFTFDIDPKTNKYRQITVTRKEKTAHYFLNSQELICKVVDFFENGKLEFIELPDGYFLLTRTSYEEDSYFTKEFDSDGILYKETRKYSDGRIYELHFDVDNLVLFEHCENPDGKIIEIEVCKNTGSKRIVIINQKDNFKQEDFFWSDGSGKSLRYQGTGSDATLVKRTLYDSEGKITDVFKFE